MRSFTSLLAFAASVGLFSCGPKSEPDPPSAPGQAGTGGAATMAHPGTDAGPPTPPANACVTFTFTTLNNNGLYAPRNVSAVWVMDANAKFVRTLEENGYIRESHLGHWEAASGGNTVDAITGATNSGPRTHTVNWDCTGLDHQPVPDGSYTMDAEFTTSNTGGFFGAPAPLLQVPFTLGSGAGTITVPDQQYFVGISLTHDR